MGLAVGVWTTMARRTARVAITTANLEQLALIICRCREVTYCAGITKGNVTRFVASACDGIAPAQGRPLPGKPRSPRSWRVSILRQRAHYLGTVQAPDEREAEAAAVAWHLR